MVKKNEEKIEDVKTEKVEVENKKEDVKVEKNNDSVNGQASNVISVIKEKAILAFNKIKEAFNYYKNNIMTDKRLIIGTVAFVAVIVLLVILLFVNPSKSVAKQYADAMVEYDAKAIVNITHKDVIDYFEDFYGDDYKDYLKDYFDQLEDSKYKYREYELSDDYKKYDKDDVEDFAEDWDDLYGLDEKSVSAVRRYTIKFKVSNDGKRDTIKVKVLVAKIDGKWYFMGEE
ncbi:MAG: hypothetical protein ACI4XM_05470 [Candidatus Coprovivens sp.]